MAESSAKQVNERVVLIQQSGELSEFVDLLNELAIPIEIRHGALPKSEDLTGAALVIVSASRLVEGGTPNLLLWPRTISVVDDSSKTLVAHLSRIGSSIVIRRPVHPRTLRLLLLHEIYRGPERRNRKRILIGHPVRVMSGLFKQQATLLELSPTGARLELPSVPKIGSKIRILIGKDLTLTKPLKLQAGVVRCIRSPGESGRSGAEIGVKLVKALPNAAAITSLLDRFASGPAPWSGKLAEPERTRPSEAAVAPTRKRPGAGASTPSESSAQQEIDPSESARRLPPSFSAGRTAPDTSPTETDACPSESAATPEIDRDELEAASIDAEGLEEKESNAIDAEGLEEKESNAIDAEGLEEKESNAIDASDRRSETRVPYERRVVALGDEAARVIVGRDLSLGGMKIAANQSVAIGDVLRIALHGENDIEPLIVLGRAMRDDEDGGTVLSLLELSNRQREHLEKIIAGKSQIRAVAEDAIDPGETVNPIVVAEMLETVESGPQIVQSERDIEAHLDSIFDTGESV